MSSDVAVPTPKTRLVGMRCDSCGASAYPFQPVCPRCMAEEVSEEDMRSTGTVYAYSTVHAAPKKWSVPYTIGYVDLENGVRVFSHLDREGLSVGSRVHASTGVVGTDAEGQPRSQLVFKVMGDVK